jgi:hypothetical protein
MKKDARAIKISETMKRLRNTTLPPHNKGLKGWTNPGCFKAGVTPHNKGKKMKKSTRQKMIPVWAKAGKGGNTQKHNEVVLNMVKELHNQGKKVWCYLDCIPDIMILENGVLTAIEVTGRKYVYPKKRNKHGNLFFDEVKWLSLEGITI